MPEDDINDQSGEERAPVAPPPPEIPPPPSAIPPDIWAAAGQSPPGAGPAYSAGHQQPGPAYPSQPPGSPYPDQPYGSPYPSQPPGGYPPQSPPPAWAHYPPPVWPPPPRRRGRAVVAVIAASAVLLASGVGIGWVLRAGDRGSSQAPVILQGGGSQGGGNDQGVGPAALQAIAGKVTPAVVDINTFTDADLGSSTQVPLGAGTGMVLTSSGEVLTNNHVVEGANSIRATIPSTGATYRAEVVGVDPTADVALIQLAGASGLSTVSTGDSSSLSAGQQVVAIGNALGRGGAPSVTTGSISSLNQSISVSDDRGGSEHLSGLIQSSASISPGDSGGAIVTSDGHVVGMITASATEGPGQSSSRIGYAIPISAALAVVNQVRSGQATADDIIGPAGFLGIEARNIDTATAARLGLSTNAGALVVGVEPGTSAARAGLGRLSVITAVDGTRVTSADTLGPTIHVHKPGEQVRVTWIDQSGTHTSTMRLVSGPAV